MTKNLDIIVPILNEEKSISELVFRVDKSLKEAGITYRLIFVDDHSVDGTVKVVKSLTKNYPIYLHIKEGEVGKAYSILEGSKIATSEYIAMIDGDLQYPPEAIPEMYKIAKEKGVAVANRKTHNTSFVRKFASKANAFVFGRLLLGLNCDTQSGLKIFKREIIQELSVDEVTRWTLDMPLLHTALELGYEIGTVDIEFADRKNGQSKVALFKTSKEIALGAVKLRAKKRKVYHIKPEREGSMIGAGVIHKRKHFITHTNLPHHQSAIRTFTRWQKAFALAFGVIILTGLIFATKETAISIVAVLSLIYFLDVLFGAYVLIKSLHFPPELVFSDKELGSLNNKNLPIYSILCPLYKESAVLPHFVESINSLEWPKDKLDVLLLLEENDPETIDAARAMNLPEHFRIIVVPHSQPKTKPKACNYGLNLARGEYIVIYDAEDRPDPLQLKKTYLGFQKVGPKVFCLQSKLNYYNPNHNLLTRLFTAEYSLWFDVVLPGLQSIEAIIPLGGTSNHFRTNDLQALKGWDPFNVTEDCDLGIRLFKEGYKTAIVDSTTLEEANSNTKNWIRQRSRWIKGYFQTYLVHMRDPIEFFRKHGVQALIFQLVIGMRMTFMLINPVLWVATISYFLLYQYVGPAIESIYPAPIFYMAAFSLAAGNFMYVYNYMIGCAKREHWGVVKYVFLIPFYWALTSTAAFFAFYQLIVKPHYWEKTHHGLHLSKTERERKLKYFWKDKEHFRITTNVSWVKSLSTYKVTGATVLIIATGFNNVFGFLYNTYLGRNLEASEFGTIALIASLVGIVNLPIGSLSGTVSYRTSYLIGKFGGTAQSFWGYMRKRVKIVALLCTLLWVLLTPLMADVFQSHSIMPFLLSTPIWLISFAAAIDRGFLVANFNFLSLALIVFSEALLKYLIAVGMVELNLHAYIYAAIPLSMIIPFLFGWKKSQGLTSSNKVRTSYLQYFPSKFFSTSLLMGLAGIGFLSFDIILAKYYLDPTSAGYYTLLSLVGKMIYFVGMLFAEFTFPIVSRAEGAGKNTLKAYLPLFIVATFFVTGAYVVLGPLGELTAPFLLGDKAFPILNYLSKYTLALTIYTIATLIVDYHMSLRHYTFPATGFVLAVTQIIALSIFHQDLAMFINIILVLSGLYLFLVSVTHIFYGTVVVIEKNVTDFLDLFVLKLNGKKKLSKGKLRILIFNWRDIRHMWAGGAEVYVHELAKRWVSRGHKVTVFSGNDGKSKRNEVIDGVNIFRRGGFYTVYLWAFMYYIFRFRRRYDVVVESENGVPFFTPLYSTKPKILVVHHVHQEVFMEHLKFPLSFIARFVESRLVPLIYNNQRIVAVSESTKADIIANNIATDDRIEIVSPGIDTKLYKRTRKTTYPSFIYLGRHKAYKNIGTIILAFKGVLTKYPEAKLFIAGDGDTTWSLKELAKKQGIRKSVYFLGKVSDEEKVRLLGKSWVSLQPSSFEGWGITVLEANACGTPVIASNVKGLRDSVVDGKTGILVPVKNVNLFEKVMLELISNNLLRKELSDQAYEWSKLFEWDKTSEKFMSVIKNNLKVKKSLNINSGNFAYIEEKK